MSSVLLHDLYVDDLSDLSEERLELVLLDIPVEAVHEDRVAVNVVLMHELGVGTLGAGLVGVDG